MPFIRTYVGARYIPIFAGPYSPDTAYSSMSVVDVGSDKFIAKTNVPAGTPVTNTAYWAWYTKSADTQYNELRELIAKAEANSTTALTQTNNFKAQLSDYSIRLNNIEQTVEQHTGDIETLHSALNSVYADFDIVKKDTQDALDNIATLTTRIDNAIKDVNSAVAKVDSMSGKVDGNTSDITKLKERATAHESNIASLSASVSTVEGTVAGMGTRISTVESTATGNSASIGALTERVKALEDTPGVDPALENRVAKLEDSQKTQDGKIAGLESWQTTQTSLVQGLGNDVNKLKTDVGEHTTEIADLVARVQAIEDGGGGSGGGDYDAQIEAINKTLDNYLNRIVALESWQTNQTTTVQGLQKRIDTISTTTNNMKTQVDEMQTTVDGVNNQIGGLNTNVYNLTNRVDNVESVNTNQGNSISDLLTRVGRLESGGSGSLPVYVHNISQTMTNGSGQGSSTASAFHSIVYIDKPGIYLVNVVDYLNASSGTGVMYHDIDFSIGGSGSNRDDYSFNFIIVFSTAGIKYSGGSTYGLRAYPNARVYGRTLSYPNESSTYKELISTDTPWGAVFSTIFYGSVNIETSTANCRIYQAQQNQRFTM